MKLKIGVVARVFAKKPELVDGQVKQLALLHQALADNASSGFSRLDVVIPTNTMFADVDCGETATAVRQAIPHYINVHETKLGLFCGALNEAMFRQAEHGCTHSLIVSPGCAKYVTKPNMDRLEGSLYNDGELVTGLAIDELSASIMDGRVANTFAVWSLKEFFSVGGFDLRAENARVDNRTQHFMRGKDQAGTDVFYPLAGVEEIIPLVRLVSMHGKCIKAIVPDSGLWQAPDPSKDPAGYARHVAKMATKEARQTVFANMEGVDLSYIKGGVI